jgi:hypothetical protein
VYLYSTSIYTFIYTCQFFFFSPSFIFLLLYICLYIFCYPFRSFTVMFCVCFFWGGVVFLCFLDYFPSHFHSPTSRYYNFCLILHISTHLLLVITFSVLSFTFQLTYFSLLQSLSYPSHFHSPTSPYYSLCLILHYFSITLFTFASPFFSFCVSYICSFI